MEIEYRHTITVNAYNHLRKSAGWQEIEPIQAQTGIYNSAFLVAAYEGELCIGCLRVISDGGFTAIVVDVLVLPDYQHKGIGKYMLSQALLAIQKPLSPGQRVMVNLMAVKGKEPFYEKFGFVTRPNSEYGAGMVRYLEG